MYNDSSEIKGKIKKFAVGSYEILTKGLTVQKNMNRPVLDSKITGPYSESNNASPLSPWVLKCKENQICLKCSETTPVP